MILLGTFFKGEKKTEAGAYGKNLDECFRFAPNPKGFDCLHVEATFKECYGTLYPKIIRCNLNGNTLDECFSSSYARHSGSSRTLTCNGKTIESWYDPAIAQTVRGSRACENTNPAKFYCDNCAPTGKLHLLLQEFMGKCLVAGQLDLNTSSICDIETIQSRIALFQEMREMRGKTLRGLPIVIFRSLQEKWGTDRRFEIKDRATKKLVPNPNFLKRYKRKDWYIDLAVDMERFEANKLIEDSDSRALPYAGHRAQFESIDWSKQNRERFQPSQPEVQAENAVIDIASKVVDPDPEMLAKQDKLLTTFKALVNRSTTKEMLNQAETWLISRTAKDLGKSFAPFMREQIQAITGKSAVEAITDLSEITDQIDMEFERLKMNQQAIANCVRVVSRKTSLADLDIIGLTQVLEYLRSIVND